jgi:protein required for attachment to host cells
LIWRNVPVVGAVSLSGGKLRPVPGDGDPDNWCDLRCGSRADPYPLENTSALSNGSSISERYHGGGRSSIEQTDWHDESERAFLKALADRLDVAVTTGETTGLTMVASPRALGMIRPDYSVAVRKALRGELDKDLVKMPVHEIEKQLLG